MMTNGLLKVQCGNETIAFSELLSKARNHQNTRPKYAKKTWNRRRNCQDVIIQELINELLQSPPPLSLSLSRSSSFRSWFTLLLLKISLKCKSFAAWGNKELETHRKMPLKEGLTVCRRQNQVTIWQRPPARKASIFDMLRLIHIRCSEQETLNQ